MGVQNLAYVFFSEKPVLTQLTILVNTRMKVAFLHVLFLFFQRVGDFGTGVSDSAYGLPIGPAATWRCRERAARPDAEVACVGVCGDERFESRSAGVNRAGRQQRRCHEDDGKAGRFLPPHAAGEWWLPLVCSFMRLYDGFRWLMNR